MNNKSKIIYCRVSIIIFLSIIALSNIISITCGQQHSDEGEAKVVQQQMTEFEAKKMAKFISDFYRNGLFDTTRHYLSKYEHLLDEKSLTEIFNTCDNILEIPHTYGWKEARVVPLSFGGEQGFKYVIGGKNEEYLFSVKEESVIDQIRNGLSMALDFDPIKNSYIIGISLFECSKMNGRILAGCVKCHQRILSVRNNESGGISVINVKGAILFEIPRKNDQPNVN